MGRSHQRLRRLTGRRDAFHSAAQSDAAPPRHSTVAPTGSRSLSHCRTRTLAEAQTGLGGSNLKRRSEGAHCHGVCARRLRIQPEIPAKISESLATRLRAPAQGTVQARRPRLRDSGSGVRVPRCPPRPPACPGPRRCPPPTATFHWHGIGASAHRRTRPSWQEPARHWGRPGPGPAGSADNVGHGGPIAGSGGAESDLRPNNFKPGSAQA